MEIKKSSKADLEGGKTLCFLMGAVVGLACLFVSLEWGTQELRISTSEGIADVFIEEEIEMTTQEEAPPPPPPPPVQEQQQVVAEVLTIVEDNVDVGNQILMSAEDTQGAAQTETYVPPSIAIVAQVEEEAPDHIFQIVETQPEFPGGDAARTAFLNANIKYPVVAQENGISGRVTLQFVVNVDGSIVDIEVMRGVDPSLDREAVRVVSIMPKWKPGEQRGKPVRVRFTLPVNFRLQQ